MNDNDEIKSIGSLIPNLDEVLSNAILPKSNLSDELLAALTTPFEIELDTSMLDAAETTAENTTHIKNELSAVRSELNTERLERKSADDKNQKYTKKIDKRTLWLSIIAITISLISLLAQFFL